MSFKFDSRGVDPDAAPDLIAEGWYTFKIVAAEEATSKKSGNPMVIVDAQVTNDPRYPESVIRHYVTFIPKGKKGDGINVQFRKCIGVPFGGNDDVDADDWVGKRFIGKVEHQEYTNQEGRTIKQNKIGLVSPPKDNFVPTDSPSKTNKDEDIPF